MVRPVSMIESLGVYLPPTRQTTKDVVDGCKNPLPLSLEAVTGVAARRVAGETEFSIDLAAQATARCLAASRHRPADIDLIVCANISRYDAPNSQISLEPSTAAKLRHRFGLERAWAFDLTNACAGMFTAILVADGLIASGAIRRALVVSGEYITHLTRTAQLEIQKAFDQRLPCLTLGDAGAAVLIEAATGPEVGFQTLDLFTLSQYSDCCVAHPTDQPHGGVIMLTDMMRMVRVVVARTARHSAGAAWVSLPVEQIDHYIPHQTSRTTLQTARDPGNGLASRLIDNLTERGNTATTSQLVALHDCILEGRIRSGQNVAFGVFASGIVIGAAVCRLGDLPDRVRQAPAAEPLPRPAAVLASEARVIPESRPRVRITGVGTALGPSEAPADSTALMERAARSCLERAECRPSEVGLLLCTSVYRTNLLFEPALATFLAQRLGLNPDVPTPDDPRTLAFDLANGAVGLLDACMVGVQLIAAGRYRKVLVATSEVDYSLESGRGYRPGLQQAGSALLLEAGDRGEGFGFFAHASYPEFLESLVAHTTDTPFGMEVVHRAAPDLEESYCGCLRRFAGDLRRQLGDSALDAQFVLVPQVSRSFLPRLAESLGVPADRVVDAACPGGDLFTSSLPFALERVLATQRPAAGDMAMLIQAGSGIQVGCAQYHW